MKVEINATPVESEKDEEKKYGPYEEWEINCAVRTIIEAEEIKADEDKMKYVRPLLEKKAKGLTKAISSIADLKEISKARAKG